MVHIALTSLLSAGVAAAAAVGSNQDRNCREVKVPVTISARNAKFNLKAPSNDIEVTDFALNMVQAGTNYTKNILEGYATVNGTYSIAATYCEPKTGGHGSKAPLQILTHGVGFDRSYWDFPYANHNYSYVNAALARGYATFAYDRLGLGQSSRGGAVDEIQADLEVAALDALTRKLRAGEVAGCGAPGERRGTVYHVGHSFGSFQTAGLVNRDPAASDGIALTGFSQVFQYMPSFLFGANLRLARTLSPALASYPDGYMASGDPSAIHSQFLSPGDFDPEVLKLAFKTQAPVTVGELMTLNAPVGQGEIPFKGPVTIVTGDRDLSFCGGNCSATNPPAPYMSKKTFASASDFKVTIIPGAGHGLNLEYTHPQTYAAVLDFFDAQKSKA